MKKAEFYFIADLNALVLRTSIDKKFLQWNICNQNNQKERGTADSFNLFVRTVRFVICWQQACTN